MSLHHELLTPEEEAVNTMKEEGYDSFAPPIYPHELENLCSGNEILETLYTSMMTYCRRYAHDVFAMLQEQKRVEGMRIKGDDTQEAFAELKLIDEARHRLHTSMIDSVNALSRKMAEQGKDIEWMREVSPQGRAGYATFAILTFYHSYGRMYFPQPSESTYARQH